MEVVAARASAVAVEVHADRPAAGAPRARAGLVVERREVGFLDGGRHGAPVYHPDAVEVADACYWEQRPVALQRRTALGQWHDARSAAWIDIQKAHATPAAAQAAFPAGKTCRVVEITERNRRPLPT